MELKPELVWMIGGVIVIILAIIFAKKANINFNWKELKLSFDKTDDKKTKTNVMKVKGSGNITKQDVNNKHDNTSKSNKLKIKGDANKTEQDVNNL